MATIDDINNSFALDKQANYPGTVRKQQVNDGDAAKQQQQEKGQVGVTPVASVTPAIGESLSFQDMYRKLNTYKPPTEEELEKERRKQKRDMVLASIGNGFNAFHQAYANARGVKPIADNVSLTGKVRDRYEKIKKERDALSREYANGMLRAMNLDETAKQQKVTNALAARRQDRLDRETKIKEDKAAAYQQYQASVAAKNEEQAAYWKAKWEALEAGKDAEAALKDAKAAQARAAARLANVRADAGGFASTAGGVGGYEVTEEKVDSKGRKTTTTKRRTPTTGRNSGGSLLPGNNNNTGGSLLPK
jgi:hypothetical protein